MTPLELKLAPYKTQEESADDIYLMNEIDSNETDAPDGKYYVAIYCLDHPTHDEYHDKLEYKNSVTDYRQFDKWFISDTQVEVRSGWFHTESLIKATKEILHKQKYWGRFLESVSFVKPNENRKGYFEISVGS